LTDKQIIELAKSAQRLEKDWEHPLCLEWCRDDDWYFLQARIMKLE
jgi:phosphoenolpyruvate synthase/pyruvate phosphate dikinase